MKGSKSPERNGEGPNRLTVVALFAGAIALGASLIKGMFGISNINKHK